jgi:hypothetical protein
MTQGTQFFTYERLATQMAIAPIDPTLPLVGEFWHEGELAILVGQAGVGKSAMAFQIAFGIATGNKTAPGFDVGLPPQAVLIWITRTTTVTSDHVLISILRFHRTSGELTSAQT